MAKMRNMPDVAQDSRAQISGVLDRVGMSRIEVALKVASQDLGEVLVPAFAEAFVNLVDAQAKGIHMSRLFLHLHEGLRAGPVSAARMQGITEQFLSSHEDISDTAFVKVDFQFPMNRPALISANTAFRHYAAKMAVLKSPSHNYVELQVIVPYSSTCPCSAALARQLIQEEFIKDFSAQASVEVETVSHWLRKETSIMATPHSQRSYATVGVRFQNTDNVIGHGQLIDLIESALKTPVQAAVKREDEQEFARLNGMNLMFCEDASRKLQSAVASIDRLYDYRIHVSHEESLHPHNAVAVVSGGKSHDWGF